MEDKVRKRDEIGGIQDTFRRTTDVEEDGSNVNTKWMPYTQHVT
jgi:hypothetical protein